MSQPTGSERMERIVALAKRRGFVFPASEIYGGINGFWDYGPLGVQLKNNLRDAWWRDMVECPPLGPDGSPLSIVGIDSSIIQNPRAWEASGHVGGFSDPMVDCRETKARFRADHLHVLRPKRELEAPAYFAYLEGEPDPAVKTARKAMRGRPSLDDFESLPLAELDESERCRVWAPGASESGTLTDARDFNLMFRTFVGAASGEENTAYLRPETAQGIFLNYKGVLDTSRVRLPFGIAQIGKAFRNEVTPQELHVPHPRVRADGDGVLLPSVRSEGLVRVLDAATHGLVERSRSRRRPAPPAPPRGVRARPLRPGRRGHVRRRVPVSVQRAWTTGSSKASPTAAASTWNSTSSGAASSSRPSTRRRGNVSRLT